MQGGKSSLLLLCGPPLFGEQGRPERYNMNKRIEEMRKIIEKLIVWGWEVSDSDYDDVKILQEAQEYLQNNFGKSFSQVVNDVFSERN